MPSCDPDDARFFGVAGSDYDTLEGVTIKLFIGLPDGTSSFSVGVFDGDVGGFWDEGPHSFAYRLFKDPIKNGTSSLPVDTVLSGNLPDDDWFDQTYSTDSEAEAPSGNYFYRLEASWDSGIPAREFNNFKVRTSGQLSLAAGQDFGIAAGPQRTGPNEDPFVGSGDPNPGDTNDPDANSYNGQFVFFFYVPTELTSITFWDGDADRAGDTDDLNTPNTDPDGPGGPAQPEGARDGAPLDDGEPARKQCCEVQPSIFIDVLDPALGLYINNNPSGNREWERFVVGDSTSDPDITITYVLDAGLWRYRVRGMDAHNLNVIRSTFEIFSNQETPLPVNPAPSVEPDNEKTTNDNIVVSYAHTVTNNGLAEDDFNLEAGSGHGWATEIYHDADADGQLDSGEPIISKTGPLGAGASIHIIMTVTVPDINQNADDVTTVVALSTNEWALQDDAKDTTHVRVNQQPTADTGGPYTVPEGTPITFDASQSTDPDGDPLSYRWDFDGDGTWDTSFTSDPTAIHTFGDDWVGTANVEVSDGELTATATASVVVNNVAPSLDSWAVPIGGEGENIWFEVRVLDPGSDDLSVEWSGDCTGWSGPTLYPNDPPLGPDPHPSPDVHPRDVTDRVYIVCGDDHDAFGWNLRVEDDDGGVRIETGTFSVGNLAPSLVLSPPTFVATNEGVAWTLTATAEDRGSDDLTFTWTWEFGPTEARTVFNDGVGPDPDLSPGGTFPFTATDSSTHTYGDDGTYTVTLRVEDDDAGFVVATTTFSTANLPPALTVSPPTSTTADEGTLVAVTATAADPGSDDLTFTWTWTHGPTETRTYFNDGLASDPDPSPGGTFPFVATDASSRTYGDDCACTVQLRVEDDDGGFLTFETAVAVVNVAPTVTASDAGGDEAATIPFTATFADPGYDLGAGDSHEDFTAAVAWGDGTSESVSVTEVPGGPGVLTTGSLAAAHVYGDNGAFPVTVTVCDDDGGCGTASATITVLNVAPTPSIDDATQRDNHLPPSHFFPLDPITFNGSGVDAGSDDLSFEWDFGDGTVLAGGTYFNNGVGPDPFPSPGGAYPFRAKDTVEHSYRLPGDYVVTLTARDDDGGTAQATFDVHITSAQELKSDAASRIRELKRQALDRQDWRFVRNLDDAERFVLRSLGYADPLRPATITAELGTDVAVGRNVGDRIDLVLGAAWTSSLASYASVLVTWDDGVVTTVDLPNNWPTKSLRFYDAMWVDAWEQDLSVESKRDKTTGTVTLKVGVHDASMGFMLSLDADVVATLSFAYEVLPYWIDGAHLDSELGANVFVCERAAVDRLVKLQISDNDDDDDDDDDDEGGDGDGDSGGAGILGGDGDDDGGDDDEDDEDEGGDGDDDEHEDDDRAHCGCRGDEDDDDDCDDDDDDDDGGDDGDGDGDRAGIGVLGGDDDEDEDEDEDRECRCGDDDDDDDEEDDEDSSEVRTIHCSLTSRLWTAEERATLDAECDAIANLLVKADEMLARIALEEAKETPVNDPGNQDRFDRAIARSEGSMDNAYEAWDVLEYGDAICDFLRSWQWAQVATETALR